MDRPHRTGTFPGWGDGGERGGDLRYLVSLYMDTEQREFRGNRVDRVVRRIYPKEQIIFRAAQITDVIRNRSGYGYYRMALGDRASRY